MRAVDTNVLARRGQNQVMERLAQDAIGQAVVRFV